MLFSSKAKLLCLFAVSAIHLFAQASPSCDVTAVIPAVHAEGVSERTGDIVLDCIGTPGQQVTGNLAIFLNTSITNKQLTSGFLDVALTVNGSIANVQGALNGPSQVIFAGLSFTFPSNGRVTLRVQNLRADGTYSSEVSPSQGAGLPGLPIQAQLSFSPQGLLSFSNSSIRVGVPQRSLLTTSTRGLVPCQVGSVLPDNISSFTAFISAGTIFATTRVTEGYLNAFEARQPGADNGTRIMLRFTGYPATARLFVPALIAGSSAATPTAAGDMGGTVSAGQYVPGSQTLAFVRVIGTDQNGAGGSIAPASSDQMTEVSLVNGSGLAVFEVLDSNAQQIESAQIPVFLGFPQAATGPAAQLGADVFLAPLVGSGPLNTSYPRFRPFPPPSDCTNFADCNVYNAKLVAQPANTTYQLLPGGNALENLIIQNSGGNPFMPFTTTVDYKNGSGWIRLDPDYDTKARVVRMAVIATPQMAPGPYDATVTIDAGPAGVARYPVHLQVLPLPAPDTRPKISSVVNGATFQSGPVARNAYFTIQGDNLAGNGVNVTFDGKPAKVTYAGANQINVLVPADLTSNTAQLVVTVNGAASQPQTVSVVDASPGVFGILNQDGTVNSPSNPAVAGTAIQVFATGLLGPNGSGIIDAHLHDQAITDPPFAGAAPGIPGLQQVNLLIPQYYPTMSTDLMVCTTATGTRLCSPAVKVHIRQAQ